jgi:hypothetical protein
MPVKAEGERDEDGWRQEFTNVGLDRPAKCLVKKGVPAGNFGRLSGVYPFMRLLGAPAVY